MACWRLVAATAVLMLALPGRAAPPREDPLRLLEALRARGGGETALEHAGPPGVDSTEGTVLLLPSFELPGGKGHLRAIDLASPCRPGAGSGSCHRSGYRQLWDAGDLQERAIAGGTRRLFTASPAVEGGAAIPIAVGAGPELKPCVRGTEHPGCGGAGRGLRDVWREARPRTDAELAAVVEWLARQPLGPILGSVPASVGPPPSCAETDHAAFALARRNRERLVYVASTHGIVHALRAQTGEERFGWVPAELWPGIRELSRGRTRVPLPGLLASSPRVEDARSGEGWRTELSVRLPGGLAATIDVSDPERPAPFTLLPGSPERAARVRPGLASLRALDGACLPAAAYLAGADGGLLRCEDRSCQASRPLLGPADGRAFFHAPAVLLRGGGDLTVAALSGQAGGSEPGPSRLFLQRSQPAGGFSLDLAVPTLCTPARGYTVRHEACPAGAPGRAAAPVGSPLLLGSRRSGAVDLFALLVEPDAGRSWVIQIRSQGSRAELQSATRHPGLLTGLTALAGGREVVFSAAGQGAGLLRLRGGPLSRRPTSGLPILESLREVR